MCPKTPYRKDARGDVFYVYDQVLSPLPSTVYRPTRKPLAAIDDTRLARQQNLAVVAPVDFKRAARHPHSNMTVSVTADHRGDRRGARARARRKRLARASLPDARLDVRAI